MDWIIELLVLITAIGFLMARQGSRYLWTAAAGAAMVYWSIMHTPPVWALLTAWPLFLAVAILLTIPALRRALVTRHILALYRKIMPGMRSQLRAKYGHNRITDKFIDQSSMGHDTDTHLLEKQVE